MKRIVLLVSTLFYAQTGFAQFSGGAGDGYAMAQNEVITSLEDEQVEAIIPSSIVKKGGQLQLNTGEFEITELRIIDRMGKEMQGFQYISTGVIRFSESLPSGVYFIQFRYRGWLVCKSILLVE